jgi:protein SCO1/2
MNCLFKLIIALALQGMITTAVLASELSARVDEDHGGDFNLLAADGPVSLEQYRGRVVLIFFGFTSCPDICPIALSVISRVFSELDDEEMEKVGALFVSLDPERDTAEVLLEYTGYFHPGIVGITGQIDDIKQFATNYGVRFEKKEMASSPIGYVINHPPDILVVDRNGQLLESRIKPEHSVAEILAYIRSLLARISYQGAG